MKEKLLELLDLYKDTIYDAQSMWLSEYCCTQEEEDNRVKEDKEAIEYFKNILEQL